MRGVSGAGQAASRRASVLDRIVGETREELERRKGSLSLAAVEALAAERAPAKTAEALSQADARALPAMGPSRGRFHQALDRPGIGVIAEFKRRSPSAGALSESPNLSTIVRAYQRGGASALSILTEGPNFEGSLDDLSAARAASELPILRKDFVVDPYQLFEAVAAGADAILLIVAALEHEKLRELHRLACDLGLDALVEVHDDEETSRALDVGARLIGINNRDLRDFSVDVQRTSRLVPGIPGGVTIVSESGIAHAEQLRELESRGVAAVLVGGTLMRSPNPEGALRELLGDRPGGVD